MFGCFGTLRDHFLLFVFCVFESRQHELWMFSVLSATWQEWPDYASVWLKWWTANVKTHYGTLANQEPGLCGGTAEDDDFRVRWVESRKRSQMLCFCAPDVCVCACVCVGGRHCAVASVYRFLCDSKLKSQPDWRSATLWPCDVSVQPVRDVISCVGASMCFDQSVRLFFLFCFSLNHTCLMLRPNTLIFFNELLWFLSWFHFLRFYFSVFISTHM